MLIVSMNKSYLLMISFILHRNRMMISLQVLGISVQCFIGGHKYLNLSFLKSSIFINICSLAVYSIKYTYNDAYAQYIFISCEFISTSVMRSNKTEQVTEVYFEIWMV